MRKISLLLLFFPMLVLAQSQVIRGRVMADSLPAIAVNVMNLVSEETTVSDGQGYFSIGVKEGDMLVFPSSNYEYKRKSIEVEDLKKQLLVIKLIPKVEQLDEVVVRRDINPESLGLVPKGQKIYTPEERKLYGAETGPVDFIVNSLNGRRKMLQKGVEAEKKLRFIDRLDTQFQEDYYVKKLKIPADHIKGFQYYLVEKPEVVEAINTKNKYRISLQLSRFAPEYLKTLEAPK